ncbi:PREDICTED: protein ACCELERATED CELL DEATH 6-like [Tarenaya hassleriana]|uniref:protein ACCELERATED CELL DEATH 6-like n=1 Tax=Tarenaya hassleriana TaxID=28532 RepID=UPI00053C0892|nr:PREDICTED: protein ACCELERATED CELL DEATH 6-like [Tarenaya hassleriana]
MSFKGTGQDFKQKTRDPRSMGKSDIEIAVLRHRRARAMALRRRQAAIVALPNDNVHSMDPRTYKAITKGNIEEFETILQDIEVPVLGRVTPEGNSILHLAAIYGHTNLVVHIIVYELRIVNNWEPIPQSYQGLLVRPNFNGDLPLHVAAAAGHASVVDTLIEFLTKLPVEMKIVLRGPSKVGVRDYSIVQNNTGNTALHLAMKAKHEAVARNLVAQDRRTPFILNNEEVSPLFMAAEAGNVLLVTRMLQSPVHVSFEGKSAVHAAIKSKKREILDLLLDPYPELITSQDEERRSPLSFAAFTGYEEGACCLLEKFGTSKAIAYVRDPDGFFPIHNASRKGHAGTLEVILQFFPDTIELLTVEHRNVLHTAAESGQNEVVKYILGNRKYGKLINQKDNVGNTPLHLAAMHSYPRVVHTLSRDKRVNLGEINNEGFTALDLAEEYMDSNPTFRERLTWMALVCADTPRALKLAPLLHQSSDSGSQEVNVSQSEMGILQLQEKPTAKNYKGRVNTLLLLAILVATMAFSAAFKIPRVLEDNEMNVANHFRQVARQVFVVSNTTAMYSAVLTTVALIWAQLGDLQLILTVFKFVLPLLGCAFTSMSLAFVAGLLVVVGDQNWLSVFLIASGSVFFLVLLLLIVPFICPYTSSTFVFRYVLRYPFCLLLLTVWNDTDDDFE